MDLNRFDDYPFHQGLEPLHVPATSDSHFNDGYYFAFYESGRHVACGLRLHPNNNVLDGYAAIVDRAEQRTIRLSRALLPEYDRLEVGPLSVAIERPMRTQRLQLLENPLGIEFDVTIEASAPPFLEATHRQYRYGRLLNHVRRYSQSGRATGTLMVDGARSAVRGWFACRDHSWGVRASMGPHVPIGGHASAADRHDPRGVRIWIPFEVDDHVGFFHTHEDSTGAVLDFEGRLDFHDGRRVDLVAVEHAFEYAAGTRRLEGGELTLHDAEGEARRYRFGVVCGPLHPQALGYVRGWADGGQPGVFRGLDHSEWDRFSVADPARTLGPEHVPEQRRVGGCQYASTIEAVGGASGMAHVEHMIYGPYEPYGFE